MLLSKGSFQITHFDSDTKTVVDKAYFYFGASSGFRKTNNYNDLKENQIQYINGANTTIVVSKIATGRLGTLADYNVVPLNIDIAITPTILRQRILGVNAYYRTEFGRKPQISNAGLGLYFTKSGQPTNVIGGLAWQFNDFANKLESKDDLLRRSTVFFYLGYTISGN